MMAKAKKIRVRKFELVDHGITASQYFQGCGTAYTEFDYVATGHGDNPAEALEDALEMIAQSHDNIDIDHLERKIRAEFKGGRIPEYPSATEEMLEANGYGDDEQAVEPDRDDYDSEEEYQEAHDEWETYMDEREGLMEECDSYYYISIRYSL